MEELFCQPCIAVMPAGKFWLSFLIVTAVSFFCLLWAKNSFIKARLIEDMPTSRIRSASQGYVELVGLATLQGQPLTAPLTGQPCLWWRYKIERYQKSGKSRSWTTVDRGASTEPFFMDDGSGICRIEPEGADISCLHKKVWYGSSRLPHTAVLTLQPTLLNRFAGLMTTGRYRYTELLIRDGDPLYLLGHFISDATGRRVLTIDQIAGQLIREWKRNYQDFLVRFDSDGNGSLDDTEWLKARDAAGEEALRIQAANSGADAEHVVKKPEDSGLPYLIGSHGQEALSRKFRWSALGGAALFLAAGAMATWLLSSRFLSP